MSEITTFFFPVWISYFNVSHFVNGAETQHQQPQLEHNKQHSLHCSLISSKVSHDKLQQCQHSANRLFSSLLVYQGLRSEKNKRAPKSSSANVNGAIVSEKPSSGLWKQVFVLTRHQKLYFSTHSEFYCMFIWGVIFLRYLIYCRSLPIGLCFYASL